MISRDLGRWLQLLLTSPFPSPGKLPQYFRPGLIESVGFLDRIKVFSGIFFIFSACFLLQPTTAQAFGATQCAASRKGSDLGCSANDVSISLISVVSGQASSCVAGTNPTPAYSFDITVNFATPNRWDVGIFLSNNGVSPQLLAASSCSVAVLPTTAPFLDLDGVPTGNPTDTCGDGNGAINGGTGFGILRMNNVQVLCQANPLSAGKLVVPFVVSWDNQATPSGAICSSNLDPVPNTVSKCNAPDGTTAAGVALMTVDAVVLPTITKTDGISTLSSGMTTTYTSTITNNTGGILKNAVFTDPAVNHLSVSGVTCSSTGGAVCPTGTLSISNMQGSGVALADMPINSTLTFSITAKVTGDLTGVTSLTNTASVTVTALSSAGLPISGTNSASDTDTVASTPALTLIKRVINATGGTLLPNDFVLTATAAAPSTVSVSGAPTGAATVINATTKDGTAVSAATVPVGTYTLTETTLSGTPVAGYTQILSCTGGATVLSASPPMSFSLAGGAATCTLANSDGVAPTLTIRKITNGANATVSIGGPFLFNGVSNAAAVVALSATTVAVGTSVLASSGAVPTGKVTLGAAGVAATIRETLPDNSWVITGASCIDNNGATTGNGTNPFAVTFDQTQGTTGTQNTFTIPALQTRSGADLVCTVTNSRRTLVSSVTAPTTTNTFKLDYFNSVVPITVTTDTALPANGSLGNVTPIVNSGSYVLTETDNMGKIVGAKFSYICVDGNGSILGTGSIAWGGDAFVVGPNPVVFPVPSGTTLDAKSLQVTCQLKNAGTKPFLIIKSTAPTSTDTFSFTRTAAAGKTAFDTILTTSLVGSNNGVSNVYSSAPITGSNTDTYTVSEVVPNGWLLSSIICYKNGALVTGGTLPTTPALALTATGDDGFCFFNNSRRPTVTIRKSLTPVAGNVDTFDLKLQQNAGSLTTRVTGGNATSYTTPNTMLSPGDTIIVGEAGTNLASYDASLVCTDTSVTPNVIVLSATSSAASSFTSTSFVVKTGQIIDCVFTNSRRPLLTVAASIVANGGVTRVNSSDEFLVSISNGGLSAQTVSPALSVSTGTIGKFSAIAGITYTLREVGVLSTDLTKYTRTSSCTNNGVSYTPASSTSTATDISVTVTPVAGDDIVCTFTDTPKSPTVMVTKTTVGGFGSGFAFGLSNPLVSNVSVATVAADTPVTVGGSAYTEAIGTAVTITESTVPSGWTLTGAGCSGLNGSDSVDTSNLLAGHYIVIPASSVVAGAAIQCNFSNTKNPGIVVKKVLVGGTGGEKFDLRINNVGIDPDGASPVGGFVNNDSNALNPVFVAPGSAVSVSEFVTSGAALSNYTSTVDCPGTVISNQVYSASSPPSFIPSAGQSVTCTFTNSLEPKLTLIKRVVGYAAAADSFSINIGGITSSLLPLTVGAVDAYGSTITYQAVHGTTYTMSETGVGATNLANYTTTYSCVNANLSGTANSSGTLAGTPTRSFTFTPTYNDQITCTITNRAITALITLDKKLGSARYVSTDQFTVQIKNGSGTVVNSTVNSTTSGSTGTTTNQTAPNIGSTGAYTAIAGSPYTLTEVGAGSPVANLSKYAATLNCINNGVPMAGPPFNGSVIVDLSSPPIITTAAGDVIFCAYTNNVIVTGVSVSGKVYNDSNFNSLADTGESWSGGPTVYAKLFAGSCPATGSASAVESVVAPGGIYSFTGVAAGTYCVVLSSNTTVTDTVASFPAGWLNVAPATGTLRVSVAGLNVVNQNFGLANGSMVSGRVFLDTGNGGGTANDGIQNGTEVGLSGVMVAVNNAGCPNAGVCGAAQTDGAGNYSVWVPSSATGTVSVTQSLPTGVMATGGSPGNTGGAFTRASNMSSFTIITGTNYAGVNFGDAPLPQLLTDGTQGALPGTAVTYPHTFIAGTSGTVTFAVASLPSPAVPVWSDVLYVDSNCNGTLETGEPTFNGVAIALTAGQQVCLIVKDFIPSAAGMGSNNQITVTATFTPTGATPALSAMALIRRDVTTVNAGGDLQLHKLVSAVTALPGDSLTYTVQYTNAGVGPLTSVVINDWTPAYTVFQSASCGVLPLNLTGCVIGAPAVNATGAIAYTMAGSLAPGGSGAVTFIVKVNP